MGCRGRDDPGAEPCVLLPKENGALSAKCCPGCASAVLADGVHLSVVLTSGVSKDLKAAASNPPITIGLDLN